MVLRSSAPVRDLRFSPSSAQPFTLVAVTSSGTLTRYDIRFVSRASGGATDRIAAHLGACLALDWRDNLRDEGEADRKEGGWVATAVRPSTLPLPCRPADRVESRESTRRSRFGTFRYPICPRSLYGRFTRHSPFSASRGTRIVRQNSPAVLFRLLRQRNSPLRLGSAIWSPVKCLRRPRGRTRSTSGTFVRLAYRS